MKTETHGKSTWLLTEWELYCIALFYNLLLHLAYFCALSLIYSPFS